MSRFWAILCGIFVVIAGVGGVISYRTSHAGFGYYVPVADIILGLLVIGVVLSPRRRR